MAPSLQGHRIGFIGLGNMGAPMARHLHQAGAELIVWNRSPGPLQAAVDLGMTAADSPADLARQVGPGVIGLNLTDTATVELIALGASSDQGGSDQGACGLSETIDPAAVVIDFGTSGVAATRRLAQRFRWVDAPVSGGQVGAEAATLSIMVGGAEEDVRRAWPLLQTVGQRVTHLGPAGSGQVTKLANQLIVAQTIDAVAQALRLAQLAGVDPAAARQAMLGGFADSRILDLHGQRIIDGNFVAGGRSRMQLKDVRLVCELAADVGLQSPTLENSLRQWIELVEARGGGEWDHSALFTLYDDAAARAAGQQA